MNHSTGKPTKAQQARLDAIHAMPCRACVKQKVEQPSTTEAHHLVDKGYRSHSGGHDATIPLCGWHHRGDVRGCQKLCNPPTMRNAEASYGPSLAMSKKAFIRKYGTERELLEQTDAELGSAVAA
jgi:hypothetical protein